MLEKILGEDFANTTQGQKLFCFNEWSLIVALSTIEFQATNKKNKN